MRTKMFAIITVCILLLAKTLLDEGCELSITFCFASCRLHTGDGTNRLAISSLITKLLVFIQRDCERTTLGSFATHSASMSAGRASL